MQVLVNSDHHIVGSESLTRLVENAVQTAVGHFADRITRVEVHLNDENSREKSGDNDKRCMMEARVGGLKPIAVTSQAATLPDAIDGAADKLARALEHALGRLDETAGREPRASEVADVETLRRLEESERRGPASPS